MQIAFLVSRFPVLSQQFILDQMIGLVDRGHALDVLSVNHGQPYHLRRAAKRYRFHERILKLPLLTEFAPDGRSNRVPFEWSRNAGNARLLEKIEGARSRKLLFDDLKSRAYDVIHCQFGPLGLQALALRSMRLLSGKIITSFRGYDATWFPNVTHRRVYENLFRHGDLFLPVCDAIRKRIIELGCAERKAVVHRSGIDCRKITFSPRAYRRGESIRLASVARLVPKKGLEFAIRAVGRLITRYPNIRYEIVGGGPLAAALSKLIHEIGAEQNIFLLGRQGHDETIAFLKRCHIFLCSSVTCPTGDTEGIPNSLKEAMATGMPVIATRHAGVPELLVDQLNGFLVPERDVDSMAQRLTTLIEAPSLWKRFAEAGRDRIEQQYSSETLNRELVDIYKHLLKGPPTNNSPGDGRQYEYA